MNCRRGVMHTPDALATVKNETGRLSPPLPGGKRARVKGRHCVKFLHPPGSLRLLGSLSPPGRGGHLSPTCPSSLESYLGDLAAAEDALREQQQDEDHQREADGVARSEEHTSE